MHVMDEFGKILFSLELISRRKFFWPRKPDINEIQETFVLTNPNPNPKHECAVIQTFLSCNCLLKLFG